MAIIGAILGDISGSQYEFENMRPKDLDYKECPLFTERCRFTDDTVMTLATKVAILENISFERAYEDFARKYPYAGYGEMFYDWVRTPLPLKRAYGSFGNGSAMRCSFIGEFFNREKDVICVAKRSAECTHNHPEGIKGAVVTAMCIYMARKGASKTEILEYAKRAYPKELYRYSVEYTLDKIRSVYQWDVTCQGSVPVAIRCFLESEDYESFLRNAYSLPCDLDTICAIGGGIAEEYYKETGFDNEFLLFKYLDEHLNRIALKFSRISPLLVSWKYGSEDNAK